MSSFTVDVRRRNVFPANRSRSSSRGSCRRRCRNESVKDCMRLRRNVYGDCGRLTGVVAPAVAALVVVAETDVMGVNIVYGRETSTDVESAKKGCSPSCDVFVVVAEANGG